LDKGLKPALKFLAYLAAKAIFLPIALVFFRTSVKNRHRLPRTGGFLLAANHFSFADPLILGAVLRRRLWFVMAEDQFEKPIVKTFSRLMDVVPVRAGAAFRLGPIRKCLTLLKHGRAVAIFPEGQRSKTGGLLPAMPGLGVMASRSGAAVVPTAIVGTREAYPVGRRFPRPGRVRIYLGEPIRDLKGVDPETVSQRVMEAIARLLEDNGHADYVAGYAATADPR
jgi:1-acyl-sn-glycerol-3-phosphate acyltransferase